MLHHAAPLIHLIFVRHTLWLSLISILRAELARDGAPVYLVAGAAVLNGIAALGLAGRDKLILHTQVRDRLRELAPETVHIHVQYSSSGCQDYVKYFEPHDAGPIRHVLSFYPDGYSNAVYSHNAVDALFASGRQQPGRLHLMDVDTKVRRRLTGVSEIACLSSLDMPVYVNSPLIRAAAEQALGKLPPGEPDVLVVLLRPWKTAKRVAGSWIFEGGAATLAGLIDDLAAAVAADLGRPISLLIHPDRRDPAFCDTVIAALAERREVALAAPDWPKGLSFDAFLHHFDDMAPGRRLHVAGLDSTASLPYLVLGRGHSHYFGFPQASVPKGDRDGVGMTNIRAKLDIIKRFARRQPSPVFRLIRLEKHFFKMVRKRKWLKTNTAEQA